MFPRISSKIKALVEFVKDGRYRHMHIKISLLYFILSFLWILFSDRIASDLVTDRDQLLVVNMYKGWVYILFITVILYLLLRNAFKSIGKAEKELTKSYEGLAAAHEELEAANEELSVSEERLKRAQKLAHVGNWELSIGKQLLWASEEAFRLYGFPYESPYLPLRTAQDIVHPEDRPKMDLALRRLISGNAPYDVEFRIIRYDDRQERIMHSVGGLEFDDAGKPARVLGVIRDITEEKLSELKLKESHEELTVLYEELTASEEELKQQFDELNHHQGMLRKLAYNDSVTGLPNRLWLEERITEIIRSVPFYSALLFIDLDNFKNINDSFGHFFGDTVLTEIGKILKEVVGEEAIVARLGGDEFAVVYSGVRNIAQVREYARMLLDRLDTNFREKEVGIHLSASIGVAIYPEHGKSFEELLKNADTAMYKAKNHGKNRYALFDPSMNVELYTKIEMESNLRAAVDRNEFLLNYQPLYCLETRKICGFEALIRWNSAVYGLVSPLRFIPLAEETGLILEIGKWVLWTACKFMSRLNGMRSEKLIVSVNISISQLAQDDFVGEVLHILDKTAMEAEYLELEITESILMKNIESNLKKIEMLKNHGIRVALDDFGTGYSSLTYLKRLPIAILKLDKAFVDGIAVNKTDNDIARSINMLAHNLDLKVVAEGIETKEQLDCLAGFGCDMIQGFYISRPLPEDKVEQFLQWS